MAPLPDKQKHNRAAHPFFGKKLKRRPTVPDLVQPRQRQEQQARLRRGRPQLPAELNQQERNDLSAPEALLND